MEHKIKYISFLIKKSTEANDRTCSPYEYRNYSKCSVSVGKVSRKYKKIITKNCRINDMSKVINSNILFPKNRIDYAVLLIDLTENSTSFFNLFGMLGEIGELSIFRLVVYSMQGDYPIIRAMIYNQIEKTYPYDIKQKVKILKLNYIMCNRILKRLNDDAQDWLIAKIVKSLETYLGRLRTILTFIYLIIFKRKSSVINKLLPPVSYKESKIYICASCSQPEVACICFVDIESTSNRYHDHDDDDYFSLEAVQNLEDDDYFSLEALDNLENENDPYCWMSIPHAEIRKPNPSSEESSTDTD